MPEPRPHTQRLDRTHVLPGGPRRPARSLASTYVMPVAAMPTAAPATTPPTAAAKAPTQPQPQVRAQAQVAQGAPAIKPCAPIADPRLLMLKDPRSDQAAAFRAMRDTLLTKNMPHILAVSSAEAGEGKTTCAINLALALSELHGQKTLLVDANFETPELAHVLGVDDKGPSWYAPYSLSALTPSMHVATIARRPGQSTYVDIATLARMLGAFQRSGYTRIILDTAPVGLSLPVLCLAGGVLFATSAGKSKGRALRRAVDQVGANRAVGVMLLDLKDLRD